MIEVFDNLVDYNVRNRVYLFCTQSKFKLGWEDSDTLEKNSVKNLHSSWSLDEFKESLLEPYIKEAFLKSKNFNYDLSKLWRIEIIVILLIQVLMFLEEFYYLMETPHTQ